jgi:hypothetical protein
MPFEKGIGGMAAGSVQHLKGSPGAFFGACPLVKPCDRNILKILHLAEEMISLADQGDADREDVGCGVLYGVLRDTAYKLKKMAEEEKRSHQEKGWWLHEG